MKSSTGWSNFFKKSKELPARKYLVNACECVVDKKSALDLGAGVLRDTKYLLEQGFQSVTVVDIEPEVAGFIRDLNDSRVYAFTGSFADFDFPKEEYDLVNAQYALPFAKEEMFLKVMAGITRSLKVGGVFVGTFFGPHDSWNSSKSKIGATIFCSTDEVKKYFEEFEILSLLEEEEDGPSVGQEVKHWHKIHLSARKH